MSPRITTPLSGKPSTQWIVDKDGNKALLVRIKARTALRSMVADAIGALSALALVIAGPIWVASLNAPGILILGAFIAPFVCVRLLQYLFRWVLIKTTRVVFTRTEIRVKRWWGWQIFDRRRPHRFSREPHVKAEHELREHEHLQREAAAKRKIVKPERYYSDCWHIVNWDENQWREVAEVHMDKYAAHRIVERFNLCDDLMNKEVSRAGSAAPRVIEEERAEAGDIDGGRAGA